MYDFQKMLDRAEKGLGEIRWDVALLVLQRDWSILQSHMRDLRAEAVKLKDQADELQGRLIEELKQAASS